MGQREDLEELRAGLLAAFAAADVAVKAQVAGQLRAVIKDLAALGGSELEGSPADEIAAKRADRLAGSAGDASASRRGQSRRGSGSHRTS